MNIEQKKALNEVREAYNFYKVCRQEKGSGATGAKSDSREWLESALDKLMSVTGRYKVEG